MTAVVGYVGRFDETPGADTMVVDGTRSGTFYSNTHDIWRSIYPY